VHYIHDDVYYFSRNTLDQTLAPFLIDQLKNKGIAHIYIINWPGWFTNLRVWSLVCNLLKQYLPIVQLYSISKLHIYTWAVQQGYLPSQWLLYIGQQKTVRHYDFITETYATIPKDNTLSVGCFVDGIQSYFPKDYDKQQAIFTTDQWILQIQYQWSNYDCNPLLSQLEPVQIVIPDYYVQPVIG